MKDLIGKKVFVSQVPHGAPYEFERCATVAEVKVFRCINGRQLTQVHLDDGSVVSGDSVWVSE